MSRTADAARADRAEQRPLEQEVRPVQLAHALARVEVAGLERAGVEELAGVVPLVERLGGVDSLVALQADQLGAEDARERLADLGLPHARLALEQQRPPHPDGEEDRGREAAICEVVLAGERPLDLRHALEGHVDIVRVGSVSSTRHERRSSCQALPSLSTAPGTRWRSSPGCCSSDFIREQLGLTGTKVACDTSQCGACTVSLDGRAVKSCTVLAVQADGSSVVTIEGLAGEGGLHPLQEAFWEHHGLQCGFCTPGMIMSATELIAGGPLDDAAIRHGLEGNLCRCTGYENIVKAVAAAAREVSGMATQLHEQRFVGAPIKRVEDPRLITGAARFIDDLKLPGVAHVAILRSPHAHARIGGIDVSRAAASPGVIGVFTGRDFEHLNPLPCAWQATGTENHVVTPRALEIDKVAFTGAGVAAVVAETREAAEDALELIEVDWHPLDTVVDAEQATAAGAPQIHDSAPGNVVMDWECGDAAATDRALAEAEVVVRQRLVNQRLIPTPMEPRGVGRRLRPGHGQLHGLDELAGAARDAAADDGVRVRDPGDEDALHLAGGGRRLRDEDLPLPRVRADGRAGREARPAGEVDRVAARELRRDDPRPRPHHVPRGGREARRHDHGAEGEDVREPRRRPLDHRPRDPDHALRADALRLLPHPGDPLPDDRRLHEHRHGRRLPRRRPARRRPTSSSARSISSRARPGSTRSRSGAGTSSRPRTSRTTRGSSRVSPTTAASTGRRSTGRSSSSTTRASGPSRSRRGARGATSGSASRRTSRSAASRRRPGSARLGRAGAPVSGRARTCAST